METIMFTVDDLKNQLESILESVAKDGKPCQVYCAGQVLTISPSPAPAYLSDLRQHGSFTASDIDNINNFKVANTDCNQSKPEAASPTSDNL